LGYEAPQIREGIGVDHLGKRCKRKRPPVRIANDWTKRVARPTPSDAGENRKQRHATEPLGFGP
jgi:hypothetical protein